MCVLCRGPLIFCLLLSLLLSMTASGEQKSLVFSGVFAMVWIGEAVVTMQIKLLGGNMSVLAEAYSQAFVSTSIVMLTRACLQFILSVRVHHRLYAVSPRHRGDAQRTTSSVYRQNTGLHCPDCLVIGSWGQHSRRFGCSQEQGWDRGVSAFRFLRRTRLLVFH